MARDKEGAPPSWKKPMNISVKVETQISKEEYEKGENPESYNIIVKAKDETSFHFIVDDIRASLRKNFSK